MKVIIKVYLINLLKGIWESSSDSDADLQELDEDEENHVEIPPENAPVTFHEVQEDFLEWWSRWKARVPFNI